MPRYQAVLSSASTTTTFKTSGALWASSGTKARRMAVYEYLLGQYGALSSTDSQMYYDVSRFTTTSLLAASAVVPNLNDTADDTSLAVFQNNATVEFTILAAAGSGLNLVQEAQNQRGTFRWRALETYDLLVIPAVNVSGLAWRTQSISSGYTNSIVGQVLYLE
jgi:hypothetical protein